MYLEAMTEVRFIHGILGKPDYFDFLRASVPSAGFSAHDILLEGHCNTPQAFGRASMMRWRNQVQEAVERLRADGSRLVIVAHSMGTLFAIDRAVKGKADGLFLLNPPLSLRLTRRLLVTPLKVFRGKTADTWSAAAKAAYSIAEDHNMLHYVGWIPRYLELFAEIRRMRPLAQRLSVPTRIYLSAHDEMVSPRAACWFPERYEVSIETLPHSGHYFYPEPDRSRLLTDFIRFLAEF